MTDRSSTRRTTTGLQTVPVTMLTIPQLSGLNTMIAALVPRFAQFNDDQLIELAVKAQGLETSAFRLRGACVAELRRRTARLAGGRGNRDTAGVGSKAQLVQLATKTGISVSTLKTDARIHELFFATDTGPACEPTLPRDYYVTALGAPDPRAAIDTARARRSDPSYNRAQFRRDIQTLKQSAQLGDEPKLPGSTIQPIANLRVRIMLEAQSALTALMQRAGQSPAEVVAAALLAYHAAQTTTPVRRRRSTAAALTQLVQPLLPLA